MRRAFALLCAAGILPVLTAGDKPAFPPSRQDARDALEQPIGVTLIESGSAIPAVPDSYRSSQRPLDKLSFRRGEFSLDLARRTLLPSFGGSIAAGDFDGDGHVDLFVARPAGSNLLFRNNGREKFADVTAKTGLGGARGSMSAVFADYNRSGRLSLFVAGLGGITLFRNNGNGVFEDVTQLAGLKGMPGELATRVVLADVDRDGFADVLLAVYSDLSKPPSKEQFVFPNDLAGATSRLYHNNRDGTFSDITESAGLGANPGRARSALFADFNGDGYPDVLILREEKPPGFYLNTGGGKFRNVTWEAGEHLARNAFLDAQVADFNQDGKPDLALWSTMGNRVLFNLGDGKFQLGGPLPIIVPSSSPFRFRGLVADLNGDGFTDVLAADDSGSLRLFLNRSGRFRESPLQFRSTRTSAGQENLIEAAASLRIGARVHLVTLQNNGQVRIFRVYDDKAPSSVPTAQ